MIKYSLRCSGDHVFEGWFNDSATCDAQIEDRAVECPLCGDREIAKALMAPAIGRGTPDSATVERTAAAMVRYLQAARELHEKVAESCEYVGERFPEEARRIHYGETEHRDIYGKATPDDARELVEEGVEVLPLPPLPRVDG